MLEVMVRDVGERAVLALVAFAIPMAVGFALSRSLRLFGGGDRVRKNRVYRLLASSVNITAFLIAAISAMGTLGINVNALIAGLGLTGLALGLALKDTISNFIAGLMVILYSPFKLDDLVEVTGVRGRVVDMDLRYVSIDTEQDLVLIPNSTFLTSTIKKHKGQEN